MDDEEIDNEADSEDEWEDAPEDEDMMADYEPDPEPRSTQIARDAEAAYMKYKKREKWKEFWAGVLGAGIVIISIPLGIADFVAPAMIVAFVLYMVFQG
jgi:hypothetical protein